MDSEIVGAIVGAIGAVVFAAILSFYGGWQTGREDKIQAIAECEQNLPRSQKCYAVIVAEPEYFKDE